MTRVIKFRAWHTVHKKMYENKNLDVLAKNIKDDSVWKFMQYIGLQDKNGKDIYEGDLILPQHIYYESAFSKTPIIFEDAIFGFKLRLCDGSLTMTSLVGYEVEVIGNIYEGVKSND